MASVSPGVSCTCVCVRVHTSEVKREHRLARVNLLGHGKLIRGQNSAVEILLVTVFMEPLQAAPTQTSPVWVYHLQRRPWLAHHAASHTSQLPLCSGWPIKQRRRGRERTRCKDTTNSYPNSSVYSASTLSLHSCGFHSLFVYCLFCRGGHSLATHTEGLMTWMTGTWWLANKQTRCLYFSLKIPFPTELAQKPLCPPQFTVWDIHIPLSPC